VGGAGELAQVRPVERGAHEGEIALLILAAVGVLAPRLLGLVGFGAEGPPHRALE
jgi:hypothetical protein